MKKKRKIKDSFAEGRSGNGGAPSEFPHHADKDMVALYVLLII